MILCTFRRTVVIKKLKMPTTMISAQKVTNYENIKESQVSWHCKTKSFPTKLVIPLSLYQRYLKTEGIENFSTSKAPLSRSLRFTGGAELGRSQTLFETGTNLLQFSGNYGCYVRKLECLKKRSFLAYWFGEHKVVPTEFSGQEPALEYWRSKNIPTSFWPKSYAE